jgi:hypothetical protein
VLSLEQSQPHDHQTDRNQHEQQYVSHTRGVCSPARDDVLPSAA